MAPSLREWLPADHFVWFVLDAVQTMDLAALLYGIRTGAPGTTRRRAYLGKKFYNPTTRKWRISVTKS